MKALTICQPYATLICTPQDELPAGETQKRVENRRWPTSYRGPLLIHAGKSRKFMRPGDAEKFDDMPFGAVVGVARLIDCMEWPWPRPIPDNRRWLLDHPHAEGPYCFVLADVVRFAEPVPLVGCLGLFDVACEIVEDGGVLRFVPKGGR